jgi:pyocin large subunit-like protein
MRWLGNTINQRYSNPGIHDDAALQRDLSTFLGKYIWLQQATGEPTFTPAGEAAVNTANPGKTIIVDSKGNALVGDWSATKTLTAPENAGAHWSKHGGEFPEFSNASQYVESAQNFVSNPSANVLTKTRPNGDVLLYDPASNTFAIKNSLGAPRTMFRPVDGINYWNKQ